MRIKLAIVASMLVASIYPIHAAPDVDAAMWLTELQQSEHLVAAAIKTRDTAELRRQDIILSKIIARGDAALSRYDLDDRFKCTHAAGDLSNVIMDLKLPPARALIALQRDSKSFHENIAQCEKLLGLKRKRHLPGPKDW